MNLHTKQTSLNLGPRKRHIMRRSPGLLAKTRRIEYQVLFQDSVHPKEAGSYKHTNKSNASLPIRTGVAVWRGGFHLKEIGPLCDLHAVA